MNKNGISRALKQDYHIPRAIGLPGIVTFRLLCFCDALTKAYDSAVYLQQLTENKLCKIDLLFSKTSLVPNKKITLPRLELIAVVVGVRCIDFVQKQLKLPICQTILWTDSQCVLHWIGTKKSLATFDNRIRGIRQQQDIQFHCRARARKVIVDKICSKHCFGDVMIAIQENKRHDLVGQESVIRCIGRLGAAQLTFSNFKPKTGFPDHNKEDSTEPEYLLQIRSATNLPLTGKKGQKHLTMFWKTWRDEYLLSLRERTVNKLRSGRVQCTTPAKIQENNLKRKQSLKEKEKNKLAKTVDGKETDYLRTIKRLPLSIRGISYSVRQGR
ncbi:unnamed protein product [Mytilus edulis]|uniref:Uncharacterized protein n=1 Tax=Mytilus edulis TaxID=6550 RepID=A0A8S3QYR5_MYTED|nr:unnamed protein product [Mytilus edulis]